jgi:hypothetical protein
MYRVFAIWLSRRVSLLCVLPFGLGRPSSFYRLRGDQLQIVSHGKNRWVMVQRGVLPSVEIRLSVFTLFLSEHLHF